MAKERIKTHLTFRPGVPESVWSNIRLKECRIIIAFRKPLCPFTPRIPSRHPVRCTYLIITNHFTNHFTKIYICTKREQLKTHASVQYEIQHTTDIAVLRRTSHHHCATVPMTHPPLSYKRMRIYANADMTQTPTHSMHSACVISLRKRASVASLLSCIALRQCNHAVTVT